VIYCQWFVFLSFAFGQSVNKNTEEKKKSITHGLGPDYTAFSKTCFPSQQK